MEQHKSFFQDVQMAPADPILKLSL